MLQLIATTFVFDGKGRFLCSFQILGLCAANRSSTTLLVDSGGCNLPIFIIFVNSCRLIILVIVFPQHVKKSNDFVLGFLCLHLSQCLARYPPLGLVVLLQTSTMSSTSHCLRHLLQQAAWFFFFFLVSGWSYHYAEICFGEFANLLFVVFQMPKFSHQVY